MSTKDFAESRDGMTLETKMILTERDYRIFRNFRFYGTKKWMKVGLAVALCIIIGVIFGKLLDIIAPPNYLYYSCLVFLPIYAVTILCVEVSSRKYLKSDQIVVGKSCWEMVSEDGVREESSDGLITASYPWEAFDQAYEIREYFYLFPSEKRTVIFSKKQMGDEAVNAMRDILKQKMKEDFVCKA